MGKTYDEVAWDMAAKSSFVPANDKPEYDNHILESTARVYNTGVKMYHYGKEQKNVDTTDVEGIPFNRDNLHKYLKENGYSSNVIEDVLRAPSDSWEYSLARANARRGDEEADQHYAEEGGVGATAFGFFTGVADVDTPLGGPIWKVAKGLGKIKGATGKVFQKAELPVVGGLTGAGAVATENWLLGNDDVSPLDGALFGGLIGLGAKGLTYKLESQKSLNKFKDGQGRVLSDQEAKAEELAIKNREQETLDELIEDVNKTGILEKETAEAVREAELKDRKNNRVDRRQAKTKLGQAVEYTQKVFDDASETVKGVVKQVEDLTARTVANAEEVAGLKEAIKFVKKAGEERQKLITQIGAKRGQIAELQKRLDELKDVDTPKALEKRKSIRAKLTKLKDDVRPTEARIKDLETRINKADADAPARLKELEEERGLLDKSVSARSKQLASDIAKRDEAEAALEKSQKEYDGYSTQVTKEDAYYSKETLSLRDRLAAFGADLSADGLKKLIAARDGLADEVTKLLDADELDVKALKAVRAERQSALEKLQKELDDVNKAADFRTSNTFKRLPKWAQKFVISPIEKLLASENEFIAGFASRLHAGTLYHGKANTRNAWNLRTLLDTKLNRMHHAVLYSYREAVKDGYTGRLHEFEAEVADNARRVSGDLQRQLLTEMEGGLDGLKRLEVAQTRLGSVQRNHIAENQHIRDATDAYLDYFEDLHTHGKKLDMEAFRNSLGKGYVKRVYSKDKIEAMGETKAVEYLVDAQRAYAQDTNTVFNLEEATAKAEKAVQSALNPEGRVQEALRELGPARRATESSLKQRTLEAWDDHIMDVLESDVKVTSHLYALQTHGRLALKEAIGADNDVQIKKMIEDLNPSPEEAKNLAVMVETIKGIREISRNPMNPFTRATKMASGYSSVMHTLGFVVPTMTEIASVAKEFGWSRTITNFLGNPRQVADIYLNGTPSDKNTIELFVSYGDAYFNNRAMRYDADGAMIDSVGRIQSFLDGTTQRMAVFGGLLPMTDMLRMTTASLSVDFLARMSVAKTISKADMKRIEDMGFDASDFERIRTTLKVDADGKIGNTDRKTWGQLDEDIMLAVNTTVERTILHPNGITLPKFMTDFNEGQFFPRVMFKFMRFPFESYERMLGRGMQEADAKQGVALAGNIALWTMILAAKDALKDEDKQKYTGEEGMTQLMIDSFLYNSWTAGPVAFADTAMGLTTGKTLQGYRYSVLGAAMSDIDSARKGDFRVSVPLGSANIGDGVGAFFQTMGLIEETNKE